MLVLPSHDGCSVCGGQDWGKVVGRLNGSKNMLLGRDKPMDQDWVSINIAARDWPGSTYHCW